MIDHRIILKDFNYSKEIHWQALFELKKNYLINISKRVD